MGLVTDTESQQETCQERIAIHGQQPPTHEADEHKYFLAVKEIQGVAREGQG